MKDIREVLKDLDKKEGTSDDTKELMETLYLLAEEKAENFMMDTMNSINQGGDRRIPVTALINQEKKIVALVEADIDNLDKILSDIFELILKHDKETVVKNVKDALSIALKSFFGVSAATTDSMDKYFIIIDGYSAIRLDIKCWFRAVSSKSLYEHFEKISCLVATTSIVDLSKIDISTFIYFYQQQLIKVGMQGKELEEQIEVIRKIYDKFRQNLSN